MANYRVIVEVVEIRGKCPYYKVGDKFVVNKQELPLDQVSVNTLCLHSICGLYGSIMMVRGGIVKSVCCQCLDPGPPYAEDGGTVIFKVKRGIRLK